MKFLRTLHLNNWEVITIMLQFIWQISLQNSLKKDNSFKSYITFMRLPSKQTTGIITGSQWKQKTALNKNGISDIDSISQSITYHRRWFSTTKHIHNLGEREQRAATLNKPQVEGKQEWRMGSYKINMNISTHAQRKKAQIWRSQKYPLISKFLCFVIMEGSLFIAGNQHCNSIRTEVHHQTPFFK